MILFLLIGLRGANEIRGMPPGMSVRVSQRQLDPEDSDLMNELVPS